MRDRIDRREFAQLAGSVALAAAGAGLLPGTAPAQNTLTQNVPAQGAGRLEMGLVKRRRARFFTALEGSVVRCDLCPASCRIEPGERGRCGVRENASGTLDTLAWGNPCAVNIDPVENKPFYHVLPGSKTLSLATAGCCLSCKSCLNWEASQALPEETFNYDLPPELAVDRAASYGCRSIASSYVEPVVFFEYVLDIGRLCHERPLLHLVHSAGYVNRQPLEEICKAIDAACIDLKGFTAELYRDLVGGELEPVLATLETLKEKGIHTEIVNLLIPGMNDDPEMLRAMCRWIKRQLGADVPLHFYRFYPRYRLKGIPPTPVPTLERARDTALAEGLHFAYIANVPEHPGKHTYCPACQELLIKRTGLVTEIVSLSQGRCGRCGREIPGIWS